MSYMPLVQYEQKGFAITYNALTGCHESFSENSIWGMRQRHISKATL